jgi:hypothetical protein
MAPFKSSLAKSAGKLFGVFREADLSLRGATQSTRRIIPPGSWPISYTLKATSVYTAPHTSSSGSRSYDLIEIIAVGAGGGPNGGSAGQGGFTIGRFYIPTAQDLLFAVGSTGADGEPGPGAGGAGWSATIGNGGSGFSAYAAAPGSYGGSGGGGLTGVFRASTAPEITQANALVIAGGGGGVRYSGGIGGNGGGSTADASPSPGTSSSAGGGTQAAGGAGATNQPGSPPITAGTGTALTGGNNGNHATPGYAYAGGGGGAGYWGGGGGGASSSSSGTNSSGGGGGSGYINSTDADFKDFPAIQRNYTGMGYATGTGAGTHPLGAGKDHPQISPLGTEYGNAEQPGYLIINYYGE